MSKPSEASMHIAAQCWCDEETKHKVMDADLAVAFAKRLDDQLESQAAKAEKLVEVLDIAEDLALNAIGLCDNRKGYEIRMREIQKLLEETLTTWELGGRRD